MKKIIKKISYALLLTVFLFTSCTIQKRRYSEGFYTKWNNTNKKQIQKNLKQNTETTSNEDVVLCEINTKTENYNPNYTASLNSPGIILENKNIFDKNTYVDNKCDVILLKTGDEIQGKVTEITLNEIKYKKCNNLDGPTISIDKKDVFMIQYTNGTKDVITVDDESIKNKTEQNDYVSPTPDVEIAEKDKKIQGLGVTGFILSIVGLFVGGVFLGALGIIFGASSLSKIKKYPEKYKNKKGFAIWSIIIGIIAFIGGIIAIALLV